MPLSMHVLLTCRRVNASNEGNVLRAGGKCSISWQMSTVPGWHAQQGCYWQLQVSELGQSTKSIVHLNLHRELSQTALLCRASRSYKLFDEMHVANKNFAPALALLLDSFWPKEERCSAEQLKAKLRELDEQVASAARNDVYSVQASMTDRYSC